jgi:PleD family two-component response regulator
MPFRPKDKLVKVTASFGVACSSVFEPGGLSASALVRAADDALYEAKHGGRDRVCVARVSKSNERAAEKPA